MDDSMHDDGLVHGHGWAKEPPRPAKAGVIPAPPDDHDPGLDHGHNWACSERGQKAARR